jgi:hypothetical protein
MPKWPGEDGSNYRVGLPPRQVACYLDARSPTGVPKEGPGTRVPPTPESVARSNVLPVALVVLVLGTGCEGRETRSDAAAGPEAVSPDAPAAAAPGPEVMDREFVFVSTAGDTATTVAWLFRARPGGDRVFREWNGWAARGGRWEVLASEEGITQRAGTPWRILPGTRVRLAVGPGDQVTSIVLRDPGRELELRLGESLTEWTGPGGRSSRLQRGQVILPGGPQSGMVVEVARLWEDPGEGPGDWIFLQAGDALQLFLAEESPLGSPRSPSEYRGWSRIAMRDGQWPRVQVEWADTRSFESARRDIPVRWVIRSPGEEVVGQFEAVSQHLSAGAGRGPLLPVAALFEVQGNVQVHGERFQVRGVVSHRQR